MMENTTLETPLVFRVDECLLQRRPPRLTVAATLTALSKQIRSGDLDANFVVDILNENRLLPYMIIQSKSLFDTSLGKNTNASKIGDLIVSEECIKGTYELCISFLDFVLATICDENYRDNSKTMLASITYIANEIYTSHHIWTYRDINDMSRILHLCTEIFHQIIDKIQEPSEDKSYTDLEIVTILNLSQHSSHKQLLDVIIDGKNSIKKQISELNLTNELLLRDTPVVISVRQSLALFNKLLTHSKHLKDYCDLTALIMSESNFSPSHYQNGSPSASAPMTNIERALFDTNVRSGLLQHIFSYIYQENDCATACIAVNLIKNIAKKFSMSLMACLGSEADKVCKFFIDCLKDQNADIDIEVAIIDLLSTCVKHQPGIIELFLNYQDDSKDTDAGDAKDSKSLQSLDVVMKLLKECKSRQEGAHKLLHTHIMKFILTFWQKQHSAIERFDRADEFWDLISQPLIEFLDSDRSSGKTKTNATQTYSSVELLNDELDSYALMILAREIFCLNVDLNERKMSPKLRAIFDDLSKRNFIGKYSTFIKNKYIKMSNNMDKMGDCTKILQSWRDFVMSYMKYKPFEINESIQNQLIEDPLCYMATELKLGTSINKERTAVVGDLLLMTSLRWMPKEKLGAHLFKSIHELLYLTDSMKDYLPFSYLLTFQSMLNIYLIRNSDYLSEFSRTFDLMSPSMQLMQFSLKIMENHLNSLMRKMDYQYKASVESRLCLISISSFRFIVEASCREVSLWILYVQTNLKTDALVQFLIYLVSKRVGADICLSIVELLLSLSTIREPASYMNKAGLLDQLNMIAVSTYDDRISSPAATTAAAATTTTAAASSSSSSTAEKAAATGPIGAATNHQSHAAPNGNMIHDHRHHHNHQNHDVDCWLKIYLNVIRVNINMMLTLDTDYMVAAVEFLNIHSIRICELFEMLRIRPRAVNREEVLQVIYLMNLVLRHGCLWRQRNRQSYEAIAEELGKTAYTIATSALAPLTTTESSTVTGAATTTATATAGGSPTEQTQAADAESQQQDTMELIRLGFDLISLKMKRINGIE